MKITQIKGDGEAHPFLSPDDEFADYENWDIGNLDVSEAKTDAMLAGEYAREALKRVDWQSKQSSVPILISLALSVRPIVIPRLPPRKRINFLRQAYRLRTQTRQDETPLHGK